MTKDNKDVQTKPTIKWGVLRKLLPYLWAQKALLIPALILVALSSFLSLAGPMLSGEAIKEIAKGKGRINMDTVILFCSLMAIFYIISSILSYINSIIMIRLSKKISFNMRKQVFSHLITLPISYFDKNQTGDIVSRLSYDIDTINTSLSTDFLAIITSAITIIGSFIMMLIVSPPLILVFAITLPISIWFIKYRSQKVRPLFRRRSAKLGELNGYAEEMLSGQKTIKAYNREETIIKRFDSRNDEAVNTFYEAEYQGSVIGPGVNFISNLSMALVSMFGTILLIFEGITIDGISKFIQYSRRFSGPVGEFANIIADLQSATSAAERIFRVLDEAPEKPDAANAFAVSDVRGGVTFKDIEFGYEEGKTVISNFSLDVEPSSTVAIVGPTGAGKTTIANLLMRFYDPQSGDILLDGKSIYEITRDSLRRSFTMVLQDTWLFEGTIRDNIAFGNENVTDEDIINAAKTAGIHDYVMSLKDGYNTVLSDDGVNISKGQKQLLNISRALLSDAPILILDEATSNVDSRTEQMIQKAMLSLMVGRTSFVIAHRLSTIKNADVILVIRNGQIAESGKHDELLSKNGVYASLYNSQFQN